MPDYETIDIHMHLYPDARIAIQAMGGTARAGFTGTVEEAIPFLADNGIQAGVMCNFTPVWDMVEAARRRLPENQSEAEREEAEREIRQRMADRVRERNQWTCEVAREHPQLIPFIGIDPVLDAEELEAEVTTRHAEGARGIKLHPTVQRLNLNDRDLWPAYAAAERLDMIVLTHMGPFGNLSGDYATPALAAEVAQAFPGLRMVLAHCGGPDRDAALALADAHPNISFDCCGVVPGEPGPDDPGDDALAALLRRLGPERIAFGSDWCFRDPRPDMERILRLPLEPSEQRAILRDTAARLLGLES